MSDTKHISMRIDADILARVDAEAKRMRWSRNAALGTCVEFGLVDLEKERGPVGGKLNGKEKVAEVAAEKAGEIGRENRPSGIQSDRVGGKGGSVRAPKKGFEVGNNAEIATGGSAGVAAAGISPEGKRGVQKVVAGDHGKLLRGQSVSGAAAAKAGAGGNAEAVDMRAVKMKRLDKLVDMVREEHRVRPYPDDPIETDAVGTTGCKVTVSRPMAGRPAHAGNCQCLTCKPPKEK
jgi:hypothetical protein